MSEVSLHGLRVAVVEDDAELATLIVDELHLVGARAQALPSAEALYRQLLAHAFDLVVLDVGLPGEDGYAVAAHLRAAAPQVGIVMLTGRAAGTDMARGLLQGADLYLVKPLDMPLLTAALASVWRRLEPPVPMDAPAPTAANALGQWQLSADAWTLHAPDARALSLSAPERAVLVELFARRGEPVSRAALIAAISPKASTAFDPHRLEVLVHRLRARVESVCGRKLPLRAVRGTGYLLAESA
ncbi:MAG TPA: response regulator transcription factor [Stenotrophomonas sp.]|nr:response regulator transcription factor [Stenotrophomonas sp.]